MRELWLWLGLLAVAVGLPVGALRADRYAAAHPPRLLEDPATLYRRLGLSASQQADVQRALSTGQVAADPALRPVVVERASALLAHRRRTLPPRQLRALRAGLLVTAVIVVAVMVGFVIIDPARAWVVPLYLANPVLQMALRRRQMQRWRRAREINSG